MPYFKRRPLAALILTLFSTSQQSFAQARPEQVLPEVKVQGVAETADGPVQGYRATRSGTATKTDTPLNEVPASVSVIPVQLMQDTAMQGLGDAFRYVPGVLMHQGEGNRDQVVIRGNSTTADFYVNGVRDDAQVFRDLYNLERAEFLKGPAGMIFGRGGAGGVVNLVAKKPAFDRVLGGTATLGSHNQLRGTLDVGNKWGDSAAFRLNAMVEGADSFRAGADLKRYAINPTVTLVPSSSNSAHFQLRAPPRRPDGRPRIPFAQRRAVQCGSRHLLRQRGAEQFGPDHRPFFGSARAHAGQRLAAEEHAAGGALRQVLPERLSGQRRERRRDPDAVGLQQPEHAHQRVQPDRLDQESGLRRHGAHDPRGRGNRPPGQHQQAQHRVLRRGHRRRRAGVEPVCRRHALCAQHHRRRQQRNRERRCGVPAGPGGPVQELEGRGWRALRSVPA